MTVQLPSDQTGPLQVPPMLCAVQDEGTVHRIRTRVGDAPWLLTGYEEVRRLLGDDRLGGSHPDPDNAARSGESVLFGGPLGNVGGAQPNGGLARLWEDHLHALFPDGFRGVDLDGVDLVLLDAEVAGLVQRELKGGLDGTGIAYPWGGIADLDKIVPRINEKYCASYFTKLRTMAQTAATPYR